MRTRIAAILVMLATSAGAQGVKSPLTGEQVRVDATHPVPRRVTGIVVALTPDSLVLMAPPPHAGLNATREAFARDAVAELRVRRRTYAVGLAGAVLLALPAAAYGAQGTSRQFWTITGIGAVVGFALGRAAVGYKWQSACLSAY